MPGGSQSAGSFHFVFGIKGRAARFPPPLTGARSTGGAWCAAAHSVLRGPRRAARAGSWVIGCCKGSGAAAANGLAASMGLELLDGGVNAILQQTAEERPRDPAAIFLQWSEMANWAFPLFLNGGSAM